MIRSTGVGAAFLASSEAVTPINEAICARRRIHPPGRANGAAVLFRGGDS